MFNLYCVKVNYFKHPQVKDDRTSGWLAKKLRKKNNKSCGARHNTTLNERNSVRE